MHDIDIATSPAQSADERQGGPVVLHNVPWETYEALLAALGNEHPSLRLTYLRGTLEIMTTSRYHEIIKTLLARLIEMWAVERNVSLTGYGAATFRKRAKERGLEPDECYVLDQPVFDHEPEEHELPDVPDIAIEVVHTHVVDKMDVYAGLGVREVWIWRDNRLIVHDLANEAYVARETSALLPDLDLVQLASFVRVGPNQTELVRSYRDALRAADR